MSITVTQGNIAQFEADAIVVNLFEGVAEPAGATGAVDKALGGAIHDLIAGGDFDGQLRSTAVLYARGALPAPRVIVVGLGPLAAFGVDRARQASAAAVQKARDLGARRVATIAHGGGIGGLEVGRAAQAAVEGALHGLYAFRASGSKTLDELVLVEFDAAKVPAVETGAAAGRAIGESVNFARDLVNQPPNVCTPEYLAEQARGLGAEFGLAIQVLDVPAMQELKMGALLGVAAAAKNPPRFIVLEHRPPETSDEPAVVLVGKGITFDSGGLSLKPVESMPAMKADMAGGAAVLGALRAAAALKLPRPVIGLVPATENVVDGDGYRPADVLEASNGKTVEIISTDAEGRLILADALVYARRYEPQAVVDLATLTGSCVIALGRGMAAGLFGADEALLGRIQKAAGDSAERVWPLPLYEEYAEQLKSDVADLKNSPGNRFAGIGASAMFLKAFAEGYPWAHLDIAPMAYEDKAKAPWARGATGYGVRLMIEMLRAW